MNNYMLGVDVAKATLQASLVDSAKKVVWSADVLRTWEGVEGLLAKTPAGVAWVLEPTGRYSREVAEQVVAAGGKALLAQPRRAKAFLSSVQNRVKCDRVDSIGLGMFGHAVPLPPYPLRDEATMQLENLLSTRRTLVDSRTRMAQQAAELPEAKEWLAPVIAFLNQELAKLDREIAQCLRRDPRWAVAREMQRVPGIGPVTAAAATVCLAARQFEHSDQFVAFMGLDVKIHQSGPKCGELGLTKQGDPELRRLFYLAARAGCGAKDSPFKEQFERELAKGMSKTAAHNAVARKMARLCWSLHRHQTTYEPSRVYTQRPPTQQNGAGS